MKEVLDTLSEDVKNASDARVLKAKDSANSSKSIYIAQFQEDLNLWMRFIDLDGEHNRLKEFSSVYNESDSPTEIQEKSQWYIDQLQEFEFEKIVDFENTLNDRKVYFSESEYTHFNSVIQSLKISIEYQTEVFEEFGYGEVESEVSLSEKVKLAKQAKQAYSEAEVELKLLETELEI